jgi:translation initiation factor 6
MRIEKKTIDGSPFIGVFASVTEKIGIFPRGLEKKESKSLSEVLGVELIHSTIASSNLIGCLIKGNNKGFIVPEIIEEKEKNFLEEQGLKVKVVSGVKALGNLVALNNNGGILSTLLPEKSVKEIKGFFKIPFKAMDIASNEIVGSCVVVTDKGFLVNPRVSEQEFNELKKIFKVDGMPTTANYGNPFIGNDLLANSNGVVVGEQTSPFEILRVDEGLSGE